MRRGKIRRRRRRSQSHRHRSRRGRILDLRSSVSSRFVQISSGSLYWPRNSQPAGTSVSRSGNTSRSLLGTVCPERRSRNSAISKRSSCTGRASERSRSRGSSLRAPNEVGRCVMRWQAAEAAQEYARGVAELKIADRAAGLALRQPHRREMVAERDSAETERVDSRTKGMQTRTFHTTGVLPVRISW